MKIERACICVGVIAYLLTVFIGASDFEPIQGHMHPIGKQKLPDLDIRTLVFSPGGKDFYRKFILKHEPVYIKEAVTHWKFIRNWGNNTYFNDLFGDLKASEENDFEKIQSAVESKEEKIIRLSPESQLLETITLPFLLSCNEYLEKLSIKVHLNKEMKNSIKLSNKDEIIIPFADTFSVLIFGVNRTVHGELFTDVDFSAVNLVEHRDILELPYQIFRMNKGDELYLPRDTWYYFQSSIPLNYIGIEFDLFGTGVNENLPYLERIGSYKAFLSEQPPSLSCSHTNVTLKEAMTSINFTDEESVRHLRIPKKNEIPEDIVLASGYKMPVLGLGTALLNETTYDAVKYALKIGYRLFDLAHGYPFSEVSFAKALSDSGLSRESVFVTTKLQPKYLGYNETLHAIDLSLENLKTPYIDLYLIHSKECDDFLLTCDEDEPHGTWKESWRAMEYAVTKGKIRSLGVSNFNEEDILELLRWSHKPVSVLQNWFDPFHQDNFIRKLCVEYNIRYMGYSTLGSRWQLLGLDYNPVMTSDLLTAISAHYDYILSHVVLRWAIHNNVTVIPRSADRNHIAQNFRALEIKLHEADINDINALNAWLDGGEDEEEDEEESIFG